MLGEGGWCWGSCPSAWNWPAQPQLKSEVRWPQPSENRLQVPTFCAVS